jgi:multiple sugar transport system substrate-binding protein
MSNSTISSRINRRHFLASSAVTLGSLAGAGAILNACNTSSPTSSGSTKGGGSVTTLTVMYASNEFTKEYIAEFEKLNPDIKIKFLEFDQTRLNSMFAANNPPDFIRGAAVGSSNNSARGLALSLDPYLDKSSVLKKSDLLAINDAWRWDGKQTGQGPYYGITKDWSQDATLWYNQALFDQAKIPYLSLTEPITYDQLLSAATKLTTRQGGKTLVYGFGAEWAWNLFAPLMTMIAQQGGEVYNADRSEVDFTKPEARKAIEWYVNYQQARLGPTSLDPAPDGWDGPDFLAKRMAISQDGYWFGGNVVTASDDIKTHVRLAPAPTFGSKRFSPSYAGIGAWIPAASKNKDAAWKLMEYFMGGRPALDRAKSGWGIPALKSLLPEMPQSLPYQKEAFQSMQNELQYIGILPDSPYITVTSYNTIFDKYIQQAARKQISATAACELITKDANNLLKQGKQQLS